MFRCTDSRSSSTKSDKKKLHIGYDKLEQNDGIGLALHITAQITPPSPNHSPTSAQPPAQNTTYIPNSMKKERMSSISSRGPSSVSENDNRQNRNNSRASGNMVTSQGVDTPPPSPAGDTPVRGSKACCFCWCCCCSCSCLTVKNGEDNKPKPTNRSFNEKEEPPTPEEIVSWSESFDRLMQCISGRKIFREFLRSEYSEENMLFWIACEDLKTTENPDMVEEKARLIYEDYISILSPKEVSLDSRVRELINKSMVEPSPFTFDEAQLQIYTLMHRDSYPRFLNSSIYKKLLEQCHHHSAQQSSTVSSPQLQ